MTEVSAQELLAEVRTLRRRARRDRRASAFPLFLFGALILLAPLFYVPADPLPPELVGQVLYVDEGPFPLFHSRMLDVKYADLVGWYWFFTVVLGFVVTAWWYRRRALRIGVETDSRGYLVAAGAALAGFLIGVPLLEHVVNPHNTLYSTPEVNLSIMIVSAVLAAPVLFWASRPTRGRAERAAGMFVGMFLATVAFSALGVYMIYGFAALLVVAAALLALAWLERSVLLGVIGVVFGGAALFANLYDLGNPFDRFDWHGGTAQGYVLQLLILPGAVLILGGIVVALAGLGARR
jgi:hypothetical protein